MLSKIQNLENELFLHKVQLKVQKDHLNRIVNLNRKLSSSLELGDIIKVLKNFFLELFNFEGILVSIKRNEFEFLDYDNNGDFKNRKKFVDLLESLSELVSFEDELLDVTKLDADNKINLAEDIKSLILIPVVAKRKIIGHFMLWSSSEGVFTSLEKDLIWTLVNQGALAIENSILFKNVRELAIHDPLTGLFNRRAFFTLLEEEIKKTKRYQSSLSVAILDIDHFKKVNDSYGHQVGDVILVEFANICRNCIRESDLIARFGGEEIIIFFPETSINGAGLICEKLRDRIEENDFIVDGKKINITVSIGVADFLGEKDNLKNLVERADLALYAVKKNGRNAIQIFG